MMDQNQIFNRSYVAWPPPPPLLPEDPKKFRPNFSSTNPKIPNWKSQSQNYVEIRRNDPLGLQNIYQFSNQNEFPSQNRLKSRRFYPKKKFNNRFAPFAPRNTTSFIIRAKKSGGIASLVSPCPVTPTVLPTPIFSPSKEVLVDTAKEEWGVDGYGSMKGLIRLRTLKGEDEEEGGGGTSDSDLDLDLEEHVEVERRLDHDLSRFEMIYPNGCDEQTNSLENRVDDQDMHIVRLEEENLTLKERVFLMQGELEDLRRRVKCLETNGEGLENEEMVGDVCSEKSVGDAE